MQLHRGARWALIVMVLLTLGFGEALAGSQQTDTITVAVTIAESIEMVPWPGGLLQLSAAAVPDQAVISPPVSLKVRANAPWGLEIRSNMSDGRMKEFDKTAAAYVSGGAMLTNPLQWSTSPGGPWNDLSGDASSIVSSQPPSGKDGKDGVFYLRLEPDYEDLPLPEGRDYRIMLQYTAGLSY